jgi:bacterial/archaeal transporter family-2 protein
VLFVSNLILLVLMFLAGACVALQPSVNARLAQKVGLIESSTLSFVVGTLSLSILTLIFGRGSFRALSQVTWWELSGGLLGAFYVYTVILFVPRLGTATAMAVTIAGQLLTALLLDQFSFFGFRGIPLDFTRISGAVLMLLGTWLIVRH